MIFNTIFPYLLQSSPDYTTPIIVIVVIIVIFLIGREIYCWYFKINERIELQKETNQLLKNLINKKEADTGFKNEIEKKVETKDLPNIVIEGAYRIGNIEVAEKDFHEEMNFEDANKLCESLGDGWRLPTKEELNIMYLNKELIGGFALGSYLSSSMNDAFKLSAQLFYSGSISYINIDTKCNIRVVRSVN